MYSVMKSPELDDGLAAMKKPEKLNDVPSDLTPCSVVYIECLQDGKEGEDQKVNPKPVEIGYSIMPKPASRAKSGHDEGSEGMGLDGM